MAATLDCEATWQSRWWKACEDFLHKSHRHSISKLLLQKNITLIFKASQVGLSYDLTQSPENSLRDILGANFKYVLASRSLLKLWHYDLVKGEEDFLFFFFLFSHRRLRGKFILSKQSFLLTMPNIRTYKLFKLQEKNLITHRLLVLTYTEKSKDA